MASLGPIWIKLGIGGDDSGDGDDGVGRDSESLHAPPVRRVDFCLVSAGTINAEPPCKSQT